MANDFIAPSSLMPSSMPMPGVFKAFVSGREQFGQEKAFFNSELTTGDGFRGNATLTIYLRLHLVKRDRSDIVAPLSKPENGAAVEVVPWGSPTNSGVAYDFEEYVRKVKLQAEQFWDNTGLCLIPPADYRGLEYKAGGRTMRPNIDCRFKIVKASGTLDAHAAIDCFCPLRQFQFRPYVRHTNEGALGGQWTCYDLINQPGDTVIRGGKTCLTQVGDPLVTMTIKTVRCDKVLAREAVCHEVGHLLGLSHVGKFFKMPACLNEVDGNGSICYRGPTDEATENIMGAGDKIAAWNIMPWASRATSHTGIGLQGWNASLVKQQPRLSS